MALLERLGLPIDLSSQPLDAAIRLVGQDKKRAGAQLRFVVARDVGQVETVDLALDELHRLARKLL